MNTVLMTNRDEFQIVALGSDGGAAREFQFARIVALPFEELLDRLRSAIRDPDLWVLYEIDPQTLLARDHYRIGAARQLLYFHPRYMSRLLAADASAVLEAPLKFAALDLGDGRVSVRGYDPSLALGRYRNPLLATLGEELAHVTLQILEKALG